MSETVQRFDTVELKLDAAERMPNGWMRVPAVIGRVGVFEYHDAKGNVIREYRPPEEVLDEAAIASFDGVPLTNDHPSRQLDASNTRDHIVGTISRPTSSGDHLVASVLLTDAQAVEAAKSGKRMLSPGYAVVLDPTPGETPKGEKYDAVQRTIRGNHVALVQDGRQGPSVALRMDSGDRMQGAAPNPHTKDAPMADESNGARDDAKKMVKVKAADGTEYEVPNAVAKLIENLGTKVEKHDELRGRCDALTTEVADLKGKLAKAEDAAKDASARSDAKAIDARVELLANAKRVCGDDFKADGKPDAEIMSAVVLAVDPSAKDALEANKADAGYIRGRYEVALAQHAARKDTGIALRKAAEKAGSAPERKDTVSQAKAKAEADRNSATPGLK